jgi:hypothetical protein
MMKNSTCIHAGCDSFMSLPQVAGLDEAQAHQILSTLRAAAISHDVSSFPRWGGGEGGGPPVADLGPFVDGRYGSMIIPHWGIRLRMSRL